MTTSRSEDTARDGARRIRIGQVGPGEIEQLAPSSLDCAPCMVEAGCSLVDCACLNIFRPIDSIVTFAVLDRPIGKTAENRMRLEPGVEL